MKAKTITRAMQSAIETTVWNYDDAIENLKQGNRDYVLEKWRCYGYRCILCLGYGCDTCILSRGTSHSEGCASGRLAKNYGALQNAIHNKANTPSLLKAFEARIKDIHKRIGENGWEVK